MEFSYFSCGDLATISPTILDRNHQTRHYHLQVLVDKHLLVFHRLIHIEHYVFTCPSRSSERELGAQGCGVSGCGVW